MKISVVLPVKNQTAKLVNNLKSKVLPYYDSLGIDYEVLIVSDGSDEPNQNAMILAMESMPKQVKLVPYENHKGKGHNVQRGFLAASGDYVMFMDADMATDLHTLEKILPEIEKYDAFIASRHCPEAHILTRQTLTRRFISWMSRKMIKDRFHFTGLHDTQCGYKIFKTNVGKLLAKKQHIDGFAFDVEYLYILQLNGLKVKEVPCNWTDDPDSSIGHPLKTSFAFYKEMKAIKKAKASYLFSEEEKKSLASAPEKTRAEAKSEEGISHVD
jgi:dolichyl-phosphate beta-glucosyltransferase